MTRAVATRTDLQGAAELRKQARREGNQRMVTRMLAMESMSRAEAARLTEMQRRALHDAWKFQEFRVRADRLSLIRPSPG